MSISAKMFSLTYSQQTFWVGQKLFPDSPMYNMPLVFHFKTKMDPGKFTSAYNDLIEAAPILTATFHDIDGQVFQRFSEVTKPRLQQLELDKMDIPVSEWCKQRSRRVFDLGQKAVEGILIYGEEDSYFFFNQHHIVTDAWSTTIQINFLTQQYRKRMGEEIEQEIELSEFTDYIALERKQRSQPSARITSHWNDLAQSLPDYALLLNKDNQGMNPRSERVEFQLSESQMAGLKWLSTQGNFKSWTEDLTVFNIFATILYVIANRLSQEEHLVIGTPSHGRDSQMHKMTSGVFIEMFPMDIHLDHNETWISLYKKVQKASLTFLKYGRSGYSNLALARKYNVILNYINAGFEYAPSLSMGSRWQHCGAADPSHHLRMQVHRWGGPGSYTIAFDCNTEVISTNVRESLPEIFHGLLDQIIHHASEEITLPVPGTTSQNIHSAFSKKIDSDKTVLKRLEEIVEQYPSRLAVVWNDISWTFEELNQASDQLASYLSKQSISDGDRIGILLPRSMAFLQGMWAAIKLGATFIPIPIDSPSGRVRSIIQDAQCACILTTSKLAKSFPEPIEGALFMDVESAFISSSDREFQRVNLSDKGAYILYTSGSTGVPKGVEISHKALSHYLHCAVALYTPKDERVVMPLCTNLGFDLTITSLFLPMISGGELHIYDEPEHGPDLAFLEALETDKCNLIKLTPSHLAVANSQSTRNNRLKSAIIGGENLRRDVVEAFFSTLGREVEIYNEYGPTEVTVGCVVHVYSSIHDSNQVNVPIGLPFPGLNVLITDRSGQPVLPGLSGELWVAGPQLASGYWNDVEKSQSSFIRWNSKRFYRTGDEVRYHDNGYLEYLGRQDQQIKIGGRRVEIGEIESALEQHPQINKAAVAFKSNRPSAQNVFFCSKCGLPSNYPQATFDEHQICNLCLSFTGYQQKVAGYFRNLEDLNKIFLEASDTSRQYDCIMLLSGGKDSSYALAKLVEMGIKPLAFTLDNGFISQEALDNVRRVTSALGVEVHIARSVSMNAIFVDSLERHQNVCDGCFKTIYTLSIQLALEKNIPFIVTGLSRGQFFETRLTEELFDKPDVDFQKIDEVILNARKAYHQREDEVTRLLNGNTFDDPDVFTKVQFLDFYRYTDVSLAEMMVFLQKKLPWVRPSDTGRSTNCLINKAGIFVHKKLTGYSNYAFPYSWDVRVGHKTRQASLEEINEEIDSSEALAMLDKIGYEFPPDHQFVAYYEPTEAIKAQDLRDFLRTRLPAHSIPVYLIGVDQIPMNRNGKIDIDQLPRPTSKNRLASSMPVNPRNEIENLMANIWQEVLNINKIGVFDHFIDLGGNSLSGIRIVTQISDQLDLELDIRSIFQYPTIADLAQHVEDTIRELLADMEAN